MSMNHNESALKSLAFERTRLVLILKMCEGFDAMQAYFKSKLFAIDSAIASCNNTGCSRHYH